MGTPATVAKILHFGIFEVDLKAAELRKHGLRLKLPEQPFRVLSVLLENPGETVTREELRDRLWPSDTFVDFDHGLNNAVMRLREVLGDDSENPRFIETIPRRGYRFIAPVGGAVVGPAPPIAGDVQRRQVSLEPSESQAPESVRAGVGSAWARWIFSRWKFAAVSGLVLLILGAVILYQLRPAREGGVSQSKSLVVLPLENLSGEKDQDYFADGMTDDLVANLAKIQSLRVISRSTAMSYKGSRKPMSQIASELKVDAVVEGTVLRVGDRVRITAELVQVSTDRHLWADTYEGQMGDILALQNRVSSAIVNEIRIKLTPEDEQRLAQNPSVAPDAYENYLKGRYYWNKRSDENLTKAIGYFEQATHQAPQYSLGYAGLADCYAIISAEIFGTMAPSDAAPKARAAAEQALKMDPTLAEAETSLATVKFNYDWDWNGAADGFASAIRHNPSYATAYQRYSLYLMAIGRTQDSFDQIMKARELDPLSISINFSLGWRLYMARQYDRAIQQLRNTLEMDSSYELPHLVLGLAYLQRKKFSEAISELHSAVELSHRTPLMLSALASAYAQAGNQSEAKKLLQSLVEMSKNGYVSPYYFAIVHLSLAEEETALDWLDKAYADRSNGLVFLNVDPALDPLRSNPRFRSLQEKLKFPN